jgi:peptidoglycan/LPS O-acetylase OafA/YrhL
LLDVILKGLKKNPKLPYLEGVRFACAFAVLVLHYVNLIEFFPQLDARTIFQNPILHGLRFYFGFGSWAVPVFWMLSGYIFYYQYAEKIRTRAVGAAEFFLLRFSRLYPLHLMTLFGVALLQLTLQARGIVGPEPNNNFENLVKQLLFASNWGLNPVRSFNGPVWSVSTEVLVYGFFFIIVLRFGCTAWPAVLNFGWAAALNQSKAFEGGFVECVLFFFAGAMGYLGEQKVLKTPALKRHFPLILGGFMLWPCVLWSAGWMSAPKTFLLAFGPAAMVALACLPSMARGPLPGFLNEMGNLTYSSYMLHFGINLLVCAGISFFSVSPGILANSVFVAFYFIGVLLLSSLCYHVFEKPAQEAIRKRWIRRKTPCAC